MNSVLWWQSLFSFSHSELTILTKWAFCIASTTDAAERNWSAFDHIHNKKRNWLLNEQVNKLVYIYWNFWIQEQIEDQKSYWFDKNENENENEADEYASDI